MADCIISTTVVGCDFSASKSTPVTLQLKPTGVAEIVKTPTYDGNPVQLSADGTSITFTPVSGRKTLAASLTFSDPFDNDTTVNLVEACTGNPVLKTLTGADNDRVKVWIVCCP